MDCKEEQCYQSVAADYQRINLFVMVRTMAISSTRQLLSICLLKKFSCHQPGCLVANFINEIILVY